MGGGFTRIVAEGHGLSDCFFTRRNSFHAENHGWSRMSVMNFLFYHELSNYRIVSSHGESRRSRIIELSNFLHTESRGRSRMSVMNFLFYHELSNYRINTFNHTENRGRSRIFLHTECWECGGVGDEEVWVLVLVCDS